MDNTESTPNDADVVANRVNPDNKIAVNLNIMDNTEFTINSMDVDTNRTVQATINNAAINSTDWSSVRPPMPSTPRSTATRTTPSAAASTMRTLIARLRATTSATMQTGTTLHGKELSRGVQSSLELFSTSTWQVSERMLPRLQQYNPELQHPRSRRSGENKSVKKTRDNRLETRRT